MIGKQIHTQDTQEESESRLRAQYDASPIPTYTWQKQGDELVLVDFNAAAAAITQGKVADLVELKASELYANRPDIQADLARCFEEQNAFEREMVYQFVTSGETKHLAVKYAFVPPDLVLAHAEDITLRVHAEQAMRTSQAFAQSALDALSSHIAILEDQGTILAVNDSWRRFADENDLGWDDHGVGRNYLDVCDSATGPHSQGAQETAQGIRAVIDNQQSAFQLEYPCHSPVEKRWFVLRVTGFESSEGFRVVVSHENITERVLAENSLRQRVEQLSTLNQVAKALTTVTNLSDTLGVVAQSVCDLFDARSAIYLIPGSDESQLRTLAGFEREGGTFATTDLAFPLSEMPITRRVMTEAQSLVVPNIQSVPLPEPNMTFAKDLNLQALLLTPLLGRGQVLGLQVLALDEPDRVFTDDDVSLAEIFASDIAAALDNVLLTELAQVAAVEEERQRLARELHDSVTHSLFLSASLAETLPRIWEQNPERARQAMADLQDLTRGALAEMRAMLLELRPEALAEQRLELLLRQLTDGMMARTKIKVVTTLDGTRPLPTDVKIALYRIAQEGLSNTVKHAQAEQVFLYLQSETKQVVLSIRDTGKGFDPAINVPGHLGLKIMRERSQEIGAEFNLESAPGRGTEITVTWRDEEV